MMLTYLRSSLVGSWQICPFKTFVNYTLGLREPSGLAANLGNGAHKALELRARQRLAQQNGHPTFVEPETGQSFKTGSVDRDTCVRHGWSVYFPGQPFSGRDFQTVGTLFDTVVRQRIYDPAHLEIVQPEQYFDLEVEEDWAQYSFVDSHTGELVTGRLRVKGTVDLVYREAPGLIGYLDYKTGRKWDWAKNAPKTYDSLLNDDFQLLLYYYALRRLYPAEHVLMTIYFIKEDGPTTLPFGDEHYELAKKKIRQYFEEIKNTTSPARVMEAVGGPRNQPCSFCSYSKTKVEDGRSMCDSLWGELQTLGLDRLIKKRGVVGSHSSYGSGGGVSDRQPGE